MKVAVLIACFNRVDVTIRGLSLLLAEIGNVVDLTSTVFLVDDGSPDGTGDRVRSAFPDVRVIDGDGTLFWGGGMNLAFARAFEERPWDAYLLFNDDVELLPGRLAALIEEYRRANETRKTIVVGSTTVADGDFVTYGGFRSTSRYRPLAFGRVDVRGADRSCDTFNGNCVLVPSTVFESLHGIDRRFTHTLGDIDLGLMARKQGVAILAAADPVGVCEWGTSQAARLAAAGFRQRWQILFTGPNGVSPYATFVMKHQRRFIVPVHIAVGVASRLRQLLVTRTFPRRSVRVEE